MKKLLIISTIIVFTTSIFIVSCKKDPTSSSKNTEPTASFSVEPTSGTTSTTFTFDASSSSDNEDITSDLQVRWDWEDNGIWDTDYSTTKTATHQYSAVGTYTVKLEVKDSAGLTNTTTKIVSLTNTAPTASFTVDPTSGTTATTFNFDASGSSDNEDANAVLQVRWDWENDGTYDTNYSTTKTATHQYRTAGTYTVKLEVKDSAGLTNTTTKSITIGEPVLKLTFYGDSFKFEGPKSFPSGPVTLHFYNQSSTTAAVNLMKHADGYSHQYMIDTFVNGFNTLHHPSWTISVPYVWKYITANNSHTWTGNLESGLYTLVSVRIFPFGVWYVAGLTVYD